MARILNLHDLWNSSRGNSEDDKENDHDPNESEVVKNQKRRIDRQAGHGRVVQRWRWQKGGTNFQKHPS